VHTVDRVRTSIIDVTERRQIKLLKEFSDCENQHGANSSSSNGPARVSRRSVGRESRGEIHVEKLFCYDQVHWLGQLLVGHIDCEGATVPRDCGGDGWNHG
jgi:hypothetical protein